MTYRTMAVFAALTLGSSACFAQFETSEVLGTVHDASQKPVANAAVTLINQDTHIEAKTNTDVNGNYDFFNVRSAATPSRLNSPDFRSSPLPMSP
jgi:hypothetical protein